mmetsp:Transcript_6401/g.10199  ORF Transcript_6401/g.10199 Transcript_6401/m.10199 type:complete len:685 (-) Transcript_6401:314-2368(-)
MPCHSNSLSVLLGVLSAFIAVGGSSTPSPAVPTGATLQWRDLSYSVAAGVGPNAKQKHILKNIHGSAEPGRLIAIMGPTGSGKTSLLNVLAARTLECSGAHLSGEILVNNQKRDEETFRQHSAYVQQDDVLYAHQTVEETLDMAAQLRLRDASPEQRSKMVQSLIKQLGLVKAKDTEIGNSRVRGVSGGERKRTNLGIELTADPGVLFLDEPTSGLDSFQAEAVVRVLSKLCQEGRTIFMSIHQPSSQVYALFDQLMLLSEGHCVYYGHATEALLYFAKLGHTCPKDFNPADFLLETISIDQRSEAALERSSATVKALVMAAEKRRKTRKLQRSPSRGHTMSVPAVYRMRSLTDIITADEPAAPEAPSLASPVARASMGGGGGMKLGQGGNWFNQYVALYRRCKIEVWRNPTALVIRGLSTLVFAISLAGLYSKADIDEQKAIQDRTGALFFMVVNQAFGMLGPVLSSFDTERQVVMRERMARCYPLSAYFVAKVMSEVPVAVFLPAVFGSIVYPALRLRRSMRRFLAFLLILVLNAFAATSLGLAVSAASPSIQVATSLAPVCMVLMLLLGGFYVNTANIPAAWRWVSQLSFVRWSFAALAINEFQGLDIACPPGVSDCARTGQQVLARLSLEGLSLSDALLGQTGLVLVLNVIAFVGLCYNQPSFQPLTPAQVVIPPPPPSA